MTVAQAPADVNWLLSTAVQSGAALVAIIGGLLVSRLVGLRAERTALARQLRDGRKSLDLAREEHERAAWGLESFTVGLAIRFARRDIFEAHGRLSRERVEALIDDSGWVVTDSGRAAVAEYVAGIRDLFDHLEAAGGSSEEPRSVLDRLGRPTRVDEDDVQEAAQEVRDEIRRRASRPLAGMSFPTQLGVRPFLDSATAAANRQTRDRRLDELRQRVALASAKEKERLLHFESVQAAYDAAARPVGVRWTLAALAYLSAACMVLPLILIAFAPVRLAPALRAGVVAAFCTGLVVFFAELIRLLRPADGDE